MICRRKGVFFFRADWCVCVCFAVVERVLIYTVLKLKCLTEPMDRADAKERQKNLPRFAFVFNLSDGKAKSLQRSGDA